MKNRRTTGPHRRLNMQETGWWFNSRSHVAAILRDAVGLNFEVVGRPIKLRRPPRSPQEFVGNKQQRRFVLDQLAERSLVEVAAKHGFTRMLQVGEREFPRQQMQEQGAVADLIS